jgi:tetratricopeptide (TPR) repeat protein
MEAGKLADSEAAVRTYLGTYPASPDAHFLLGYILFREQRAKDSLAEFTAGAKYRRPHPDELKIVASDYVILSDYADADKWFSAVVTETPDDADAWYLLGRTKFNESNFADAISNFERALTLRPKYVEAQNNIGLGWRELNNLDKAQSAFETAIEWQGTAPADAQPFLNLGALLADQHLSDKAIPYLDKALALSPANPRVHEVLAQVYAAQQDLPKAQSELEAAVALAPNTSALHFKLGQIYRKEGLRDRAQQEFDMCTKLSGTTSSTKTPNPLTVNPPEAH